MITRTTFRTILLGGCAAGLIALPLTTGTGALQLQAHSAAAKENGGGGRGGDHGGGQGHGRSDRDGTGTAQSRGGEADQGAAEHGRGHGRSLADARARYEAALDHKRSTQRSLDTGAGHNGKAPAAMLDHRQTQALIARGWEEPTTGTFRNHGQRVRTMVALAKELGYPASVGALQGNFGTPFENGLAPVVVDLEAARAALTQAPLDPMLQADVIRLETALTTATSDMPQGSFGDWATVDLDVTDDGVVDAADLTAAQAGVASTAPAVDTAAAAP